MTEKPSTSGTSLVVAAVIFATAALAHNGVTNPAVMARMQGMSDIDDTYKSLRSMARSGDFNVEEARQAAQDLANHAADITVLFKDNETDPKSEAFPEIWTYFDDFTAKANDLENKATTLAETLETQSDLNAALRPIRSTCRACHDAYRE